MKQLFLLTTLILVFISCRTRTEPASANNIQLILPDTANNGRAKDDLSNLEYRSKLEWQMGFRDLRKGADSLEIRLWYSFSFSDFRELYTIRLCDSTCYLTYSKVYLRRIHYSVIANNPDWGSYNDPMVDSISSKTVLLGKADYEKVHLDSVWLLKAESELRLPDTLSFSDCDSYALGVADKRRFKYIRYHCPGGIYMKTHMKEVAAFMRYCERVMGLAGKRGWIPLEW